MDANYYMNDFETPRGLIIQESCRVCNSIKLKPIMSLGDQHLINFTDSQSKNTLTAPLDLVLCNKKDGGCGLLQLRHTVPGELMYREFWYKSGVNQSMKNALADIVMRAETLVELSDGDNVIDIGANDGTLLRHYKNKNLKSIGFEPAKNLVEEAGQGTSKIINAFFSYEKFIEEFPNQKSKVITSIAMFYDLQDPNKFVGDIAKILDKDGVWIVQMNYLVTMLENNAFDNIVHEHLEYYSLKSLEYLLKRHNLTIFDAELNDVNGGSIRTYIKHNSCEKFPVTNKVKEIIDYEDRLGLDDIQPYQQFSERISELKKVTYEFIKNQIEKGKTVYAYGASTRGNTLLQFYNLDYKMIKAIADRNPIKWGKKTAGTNIPIISEEQARKEKPDYFLILPWYFIDEFRNRETEYLKNGGKFIVPLPSFQIV